MKSQPLSDAEFERLSDVLKRFGDKRAMNLEQLDGFLSALICSPDLVPPSDVNARDIMHRRCVEVSRIADPKFNLMVTGLMELYRIRFD